MKGQMKSQMKKLSISISLSLIFLLAWSSVREAKAFCGFYVARADTKLFNQASKVVLVRDEKKTVLTMVNDYKGELKEFAIVIPVPTFLEREQIHVANNALVEHLDAYSAPRLVEYYDDNPCQMMRVMQMTAPSAEAAAGANIAKRAKDLGVQIEAEYTVGEYDILILSAKESDGLETWLKESGYKIPAGAAEVLGSYIKQKMRFFVAKVNLQEQAKLGFSFLRPLQIAYESEKFMLPIRLGMVNANGPQEMFVFALTQKGRVETTNYRTVRLPQGMDIPLYVKDDFANFYRSMFDRQVKKENSKAVFLEYAWDMSWCDPCAAEPLSNDELRELGVFWLEDGPKIAPMPGGGAQRFVMPPQPVNVFITRLHLRYDAEHFPEDLMFQETSDRENFQGRYVLRHSWSGSDTCEQATQYRKDLPKRHEQEAITLAELTGWDLPTIKEKMKSSGQTPLPSDAGNGGDGATGSGEKWWKRIW